MKTRTFFSKLPVLIMACFVSCTEQEAETLPTSLTVVFPNVAQSGDTTHESDFIHASTITAYLNPELIYDSIADIEGNIYKTIKIGSQTWMAENLKTATYNNGTAIPYVPNHQVWKTLRTGAYRWYENNEYKYKNLYGALYNWYTVKTGKLCPAGYHVPSNDDWIKLELALGMTTDQAYSYGEFPGLIGRGTDQATQMKAGSGWMQWDGHSGGTNTSGFTALPAGESAWNLDGSSGLNPYFDGAQIVTYWWESTSEGGARCILSGDPGVIRGPYLGFYGFSVRCVQD